MNIFKRMSRTLAEVGWSVEGLISYPEYDRMAGANCPLRLPNQPTNQPANKRLCDQGVTVKRPTPIIPVRGTHPSFRARTIVRGEQTCCSPVRGSTHPVRADVDCQNRNQNQFYRNQFDFGPTFVFDFGPTFVLA